MPVTEIMKSVGSDINCIVSRIICLMITVANHVILNIYNNNNRLTLR
jgi:uncharacterized membrane protein YkvI